MDGDGRKSEKKRGHKFRALLITSRHSSKALSISVLTGN